MATLSIHFSGTDAAEVFILRLHEIYDELKPLIFADVKMEKKTPEIKAKLAAQTHCHICEKLFKQGEKKDVDHSHYDGRILGYAHPICNRQRKTPKKLPILIHNFQG